MELGRLAESRKASVETFKSPPKRGSHYFLEPDLAYLEISDTSVEASGREFKTSSKARFPDKSVPCSSGAVEHSSRSIACWNCGKSSHVRRECPSSRKLKCHRCGKHGFTVQNCPGCSGNGRKGQPF